jgi:hypothetical protein
MRSWMKPVMAVLGLTAGVTVLAGPRVADSQPTGDYERVVRVVRAGPSYGCHVDVCGIGVMEPITARFSTVGEPVGVVASVSFRYRTSVGDPAEISLLWRPAGTRRFYDAVPGPSPLAPSHSMTTTSISWSTSGLQVRTDYAFAVSVRALRGGGGRRFEVTTKDLVIVLEAS